MFLKSLLLESDGEIIREIIFHKGMNFIVDDTKSLGSSSKETGNNIGKTTVLRLINFCLGGSDKGIYQSKEFKNNINTDVYNFLINHKVLVTLKLSEDLDNTFARQIEIRRNFLSRGNKILEIDAYFYMMCICAFATGVVPLQGHLTLQPKLIGISRARITIQVHYI